MPKRKHKDKDDELEFLSWKIKKLERKLGRRSNSRSRSRDRSRSQSRHSKTYESSPPASQDDIPVEDLLSGLFDPTPPVETNDEVFGAEPSGDLSADSGPLNSAATTSAETQPANEETPATVELDSELLEILGADPSTSIEYGKDIHNELASRLQHIATGGLTKESRKELNEKYLLPANCVKIGAPSMNPEIKAAVTEIVMKRDKGIEARQKQLACAISGLASLLSKELESKDKDSARLKHLMDICRILCDIQHVESITRRNFAIFFIKKELKEHLVNTKIDKSLFGENLAETLKSAKAVSKSGSELKTKPPPKPKQPTSSTSNLNWKNPAPARKQQSAPRGREAAPPPAPGPAARSSRNTTHASSSRPSLSQSKQTRRH